MEPKYSKEMQLERCFLKEEVPSSSSKEESHPPPRRQAPLKDFKTEWFSVTLMYRLLDQSPSTAFPFRSIWNAAVLSKLGIFAWQILGVRC